MKSVVQQVGIKCHIGTTVSRKM